jgi:hypothetical protein
VSRWLAGLLVTPLVLALGATSVAAQTIVIGPPTDLSVAPGGQIEFPINIDMSAAGGLDIASLQFELGWNPSELSYFSDLLLDPPPGDWTIIPNRDNVSSGIFGAGMFSIQGTTSSFDALLLTLDATDVMPPEDYLWSCLDFVVSAAGSALGDNLLPFVQVPECCCLCIGFAGILGDVTGDETVNIVDAQQVARYAIGLPTPGAPFMEDVGDVTEDGNINIIDAQQIARYSIGLPAPGAPRIGEALPGCPGDPCSGNGTISGFWEGSGTDGFTLFIDLAPIEEAPDGGLSGSGFIWIDGGDPDPFTIIAGQRTGTSVEFTMEVPTFTPFVFTGTWDEDAFMDGVINESGFVNFPMAFTRVVRGLGDLEVHTSTIGTAPGYTVSVDLGPTNPIGANDVLTFADLSEGLHSVFLGDVPGDCFLDGSNPRIVSVPDGGTAVTTFDVDCSGPPELEPGVPFGPFSGDMDSERPFFVEVPSGFSGSLSITTYGGTGDADLYVRYGALPDRLGGVYDCQSWAVGNDELCVFPSAAPGMWYILIHGWTAYDGAFIVAELIPSNGGGVSGTWDGFGSDMGLNLYINLTPLVEAPDGSLSGTGSIWFEGNPPDPFTITGGQRTGTNVEFTIEIPGFTPIVFTGTWDNADFMGGVINESGFVDFPMAFTRVGSPVRMAEDYADRLAEAAAQVDRSGETKPLWRRSDSPANFADINRRN